MGAGFDNLKDIARTWTNMFTPGRYANGEPIPRTEDPMFGFDSINTSAPVPGVAHAQDYARQYQDAATAGSTLGIKPSHPTVQHSDIYITNQRPSPPSNTGGGFSSVDLASNPRATKRL